MTDESSQHSSWDDAARVISYDQRIEKRLLGYTITWLLVPVIVFVIPLPNWWRAIEPLNYALLGTFLYFLVLKIVRRAHYIRLLKRIAGLVLEEFENHTPASDAGRVLMAAQDIAVRVTFDETLRSAGARLPKPYVWWKFWGFAPFTIGTFVLAGAASALHEGDSAEAIRSVGAAERFLVALQSNDRSGAVVARAEVMEVFLGVNDLS